MIAIALKDISPLVKRGTVLVKTGKYGIIKGYTKRELIECEEFGNKYKTPNFYPWEQVSLMRGWWSVRKN